MPKLAQAALLDLYRGMLRIRVAEEMVADEYAKQEMRCPVHLCIGQEAPPVGVCAHLTKQDYAFSTHRSHGHYLAKGGSLPAMIAEFYGKATGCSGGKGGSMHLADVPVGFMGAAPIVGSTIPIAVGAAFGSVLRGDPRVTVVFFGDGATEEGVFHESLNFAALKRLPVIFVCENNGFSVYSPLAIRQPDGREIAALAQAHGIPSYQGDGNDVVEVYELAEKAVRRARQCEGPSFLEFRTYRWREHCGPNYDNDLGYRTIEEFEQWQARCPLERLATRLMKDGVEPEHLEGIATQLRSEVQESIDFAKESPFPQPSSLTAHIFAQ